MEDYADILPGHARQVNDFTTKLSREADLWLFPSTGQELLSLL